MKRQIIRKHLGSIREHDLDLVILEEFWSDDDFWRWFARRVCPKEISSSSTFIEARRSINEALGESDLELTFTSKLSRKIKILIENKIDAGFQNHQADRYRERAQNYVQRGEVDAAFTMIAAPLAYFGKSNLKGFNRRITYEEILGWFKKQTKMGTRRHHKISIIQAAIEKAKLGYNPDVDAPVTEFWHQYWELMSERYPELEMRKPGPKPGSAGFVRFFPEGFSKTIRLRHKVGFGHADLELGGLAKQETRIRKVLAPLLESNMEIATATKAIAVRIRVPEVDKRRSFSEQANEVKAGQDAVKKLYDWFVANRVQILETVKMVLPE